MYEVLALREHEGGRGTPKKMEIKKNRKMPYHGRKEMLQEEGSGRWAAC